MMTSILSRSFSYSHPSVPGKFSSGVADSHKNVPESDTRSEAEPPMAFQIFCLTAVYLLARVVENVLWHLTLAR